MLDTVFVLALLCVLTVISLMLVTFGADLYQQIAADMNQSYQLNTSLSYVANKLRGGDIAEAVEIGTFQGVPALVLNEQYGEARYATWIYCYEVEEDGRQNRYLMELFGEVGGEFDPGDGTPLIALAEFEARWEDGYIVLEAVAEDGSRADLRLGLRSEPGRLAAETMTTPPPVSDDDADDDTSDDDGLLYELDDDDDDQDDDSSADDADDLDEADDSDADDDDDDSIGGDGGD